MWYLVFFGIPLLSVILFLVSLLIFILVPKGSVAKSISRAATIVFAIISLVLIGCLVALICLFYMALANM